MFNQTYEGKKVLITGHTGFKGSWLATWLINLGATVVGISNKIPTQPSLFDCLQLSNKLTHYLEDVRDLSTFREIFEKEKPDFIFHLAAQAIVSESYLNPIETISTNVMGTANLLEVLRLYKGSCTAVIITSDKAYDNVEQVWGYKEDDFLGGKDIYSGSKGSAELIIKSYFHSYFNSQGSNNIRIAIARAGNVIGGGDWAKDRIVVDCMQAWSNKKKVDIRCPMATRPWQHVLEPLSGYLVLGSKLLGDIKFNGEAFNFGPRADQNRTVIDLLQSLAKTWGLVDDSQLYNIIDNIPFHEATLLKLNCDKALSYLTWQASLDYDKTVNFTGSWYHNYYFHKMTDMWSKTCQQIEEYQDISRVKGQSWME